MSYIHNGWMIDGGTDWLVHAFGKHSFVSNDWTKLSIKPLCHLSSFPWVARREMESWGRIWHSFVFSDECLELLSFCSPTPSSFPFPKDRYSSWDTWGNQEVLIGVPFACLICPFHSRQLRSFAYFLGLHLTSSHRHPSSTLYPLSICNHSHW